jgi:integral membrane sensor domain MASE1
MSAHTPSISGDARTADARDLPNGPGAAAVLAAGIGSFLLAVFAILADKAASIKSLMNFSKPTGPLSGVTTCAIVAWLAAWALLHARWRNRNLAFARVSAIAFVLLFLSLLLTFPPIADLF